MDYVNENGYGNCKKKASAHGDRYICYVNLPSNCADLKDSGTDPDKKKSSDPCFSQGNLQ